MKFKYQILDVFTKSKMAGNQLAVVYGADQLDQKTMQKIAREFNFAETIFILSPQDKANLARVKISQGIEMDRPSYIDLKMQIKNSKCIEAIIGGYVSKFAEGILEI